jgi:hypothetical protein
MEGVRGRFPTAKTFVLMRQRKSKLSSGCLAYSQLTPIDLTSLRRQDEAPTEHFQVYRVSTRTKEEKGDHHECPEVELK